jgi:hypothetical protein
MSACRFPLVPAETERYERLDSKASLQDGLLSIIKEARWTSNAPTE